MQARVAGSDIIITKLEAVTIGHRPTRTGVLSAQDQWRRETQTQVSAPRVIGYRGPHNNPNTGYGRSRTGTHAVLTKYIREIGHSRGQGAVNPFEAGTAPN